jgi:WhiB family transcriptional regulator, redox-sensing transcriptional regulator
VTARSGRYWSPAAAGPLLGEDPDDVLSWQDAGLCAEVDPDLWFPEKGGSVAYAKRVCRSCPVAAECLKFALANDERWGVWGGLSERERRRLKPGGRLQAVLPLP